MPCKDVNTSSSLQLEILKILSAPRPYYNTRAAINTQHKKNSGSRAFPLEKKFGLHNIWEIKIWVSGILGKEIQDCYFLD
jgi:hypothetical protein